MWCRKGKMKMFFPMNVNRYITIVLVLYYIYNNNLSVSAEFKWIFTKKLAKGYFACPRWSTGITVILYQHSAIPVIRASPWLHRCIAHTVRLAGKTKQRYYSYRWFASLMTLMKFRGVGYICSGPIWRHCPKGSKKIQLIQILLISTTQQIVRRLPLPSSNDISYSILSKYFTKHCSAA